MKRIALVLTVFITLSMLSEIQAQTKVKFKTTMGDITVVLYDDTPIHRDNMIELVNKRFYHGILFHRVIPEFMVQAGDPTSRVDNPSPQLGTIPAEFRPNHYHKKGALAAARIGGPSNPKKNSSGSQFYLVIGKVATAAELDQLEQGGRPKFTEQQRKDYTTIGGTPFLDNDYTVFGEVTEGQDVVDKIALVPRNMSSNRPNAPVKIISAEVIYKK